MDMSAFSSNGEFSGEHGELANPCFLIRHPKGDLLWDTGFEESLVDVPGGVGDRVFHKAMNARLTTQLAQLGLKTSDIEYLSLSHSHPDHAGNANLFLNSTFIVQEKEYQFMFSPERREKDAGQFVYFSALENTKRRTFAERYDVFGDGNVVIHATPGHTPGHSVLLLRLKNSGAMLLTGDLYIQSKGRALRAVATFNTDAEETIASMDKFEALAEAEDAQVIIQHDKAIFDTLPEFPAYLD
jgi:glyoxylase-like metal-dependent hydrolase (beta-lactamase superfamily II)